MSISLKVQTKSLATKASSIKSIADRLVSLHDELYTISRNMDTDITSRPGIAGDMKSCLNRLQEDYNRIGDYSRALQNVAITYRKQEEDLLTMVGQLEDKVAQETNRTGTQDYRRNSDKKNDRETRKTSDNVPPANMVASVEDMFDISSYSIRDNMKARVPRFPEDVKVNKETTEGKDDSDINLMGMKATMQRLCKHSKLEFDAGNVVDGMFHHEVERFLDDYDTYHPKKYLIAAYRALPDKYRVIALKHWLDLIEEGEAINQSNLLPESYYEDIPYIPLEDSKLGRITAENKYASEEAYAYYKKYIYPLDAYLELHHEFKPKHSLDQEIERRHYQEWARMVYGSSKDEQGEEFRFGLFMGTGLGAMKAYVDIADMLYQLGTDPETRKAMGSLFVALLTCRYSSKSRDTLAKMIKQSVQIWQETYEEADPSNKGMMISSLITETITLAIDAGAMAKGVKGFIEFIDNGGFYKMASKVAKMGKSVKRLLKMTPAQLIDKVKTIIKLGDKYEVILHSGDNITIAFDEMTIAQRRVYDSLADGPLSGDMVVDRVDGENAIGYKGTSYFIDGLEVIDDKVMGKVPIDEFINIRNSSIHNPNTDSITLGKYTPTVKDGIADWSTPGADSYIAKAGNDSTYFSLGSEWDIIQTKYGLTNDEMFDMFNIPALDDAVNSGKTIRFSHNPNQPKYSESYLAQEWKYLQEKYNYSTLKFKGGIWYAR